MLRPYLHGITEDEQHAEFRHALKAGAKKNAWRQRKNEGPLGVIEWFKEKMGLWPVERTAEESHG